MSADKTEIDTIVAILREFSDTEEEMQDLIGIFFATADQVLGTLQANSGKDGNAKEWSEAAHKLRGSAAMMKAGTLNALADKAEKLGSAPAPEKQKLLEDVRRAVDDIRAGLHGVCWKKAV